MDKYIFHVHTCRCGHASPDPDEMYIKKAIELGADSITFTDHAPFPGDPFDHRMRYGELKGYISSLNSLKNQYRDVIDVRIGLEIEYLPAFESYYDTLKKHPDIDILMLGQHHFELPDGTWSFSKKMERGENFIGLMDSQIQGVKSGSFDVIAHPDRCFRFIEEWNADMDLFSRDLILECARHNVMLEKNLESMKTDYMYWPEFWNLVPGGQKVIIGCDAHAVEEIRFAND
jgi:histidinol-phosphatase (PHP family)